MNVFSDKKPNSLDTVYLYNLSFSFVHTELFIQLFDAIDQCHFFFLHHTAQRMANECSMCPRTFRNQKSLSLHKRNAHDVHQCRHQGCTSGDIKGAAAYDKHVMSHKAPSHTHASHIPASHTVRGGEVGEDTPVLAANSQPYTCTVCEKTYKTVSEFISPRLAMIWSHSTNQ